jgi:methylated-DNA-protein-cysteine methyltransferase-like protein
MMHESSQRVVNVIRDIPPGRVLSYGEVARRAGLENGARTVARILHSSSSKHDLPWHRVVNSAGKISLPDAAGRRQKRLLQREGVKFRKNGSIDMTRYAAW